MINFKTIRCSNCNTVLFNMPEEEVKKLDGKTCYCECCNKHNLLNIKNG